MVLTSRPRTSTPICGPNWRISIASPPKWPTESTPAGRGTQFAIAHPAPAMAALPPNGYSGPKEEGAMKLVLFENPGDKEPRPGLMTERGIVDITGHVAQRSEERRVGKECRSRGPP